MSLNFSDQWLSDLLRPGGILKFWKANQHPDVNYTVVNNLPNWAYPISSTFLATVGVFGILANGVIIAYFLRNKSVRTPFNFLLMNMVVAEFIIATIGVPIDFVASYEHGWTMGFPMCVFTGFVLTTAGLVSLQTLTVLSLQRLTSTAWPKQFKGISMTRIWQLITYTWLVVATISVPPLFGWGRYVPETSGLSCAPDWESGYHRSYVVWLFGVGFFIPLGIIVVASSLTIWKLHKISSSINEKNVRRRSIKRSSKVSVLIIWMNVVFLICWLPYGVLCFLRFIAGESLVPDGAAAIPLLLAKTSICWNPVLYIFLNPQFAGLIRSKKSRLQWKRQQTRSEITQSIQRRRDITFETR